MLFYTKTYESNPIRLKYWCFKWINSIFLQSEDIESLIPKGLSEFTKQQIRYILQVRWDYNDQLCYDSFASSYYIFCHVWLSSLRSLSISNVRQKESSSRKEQKSGERGEVDGGETIIRIYSVRKKIPIFS